MQCDMCGKEEQLYQTDVEGGILNVCKACSRFGKVISVVRPKKDGLAADKAIVRPVIKKELVQVIVDDFGPLIKRARERLGLNQEELAKMLAEKESKIQKLESGQYEPPIDMARKLERQLKIKLIEQHEEAHDRQYKVDPGTLTIGDVLEIKRRQ
jgi:putative transcription factor